MSADLPHLNERTRAGRAFTRVALPVFVALSLAATLSGCGKKSVVGATIGAAGSAVGAAGNVAGAAVNTAGTVAGTTASAAGSAVSAGASAATTAGTTSAATTGTTAAAAGSSGTVMTTPMAAGIGLVGMTAAADYDAKNRDPANIAEGVANCLRAGPDYDASGELLIQAGWIPSGKDPDLWEFKKGNVRGQVLSDGNCVFRSELITTPPVDAAVRAVVAETFPNAKVKKAANKGEGLCDGFTLRQSRKNQAWIYYTDSTGAVCTRYGAGVVVQFL